MSLLDRLLRGKIKHGRLTIVSPDGQTSVYGDGASGWPDVTMRIQSQAAARRILLNPRLGMGETYMDGGVTVDDDDIMGFVEIIRRNNPWENGGEIGDPKPLKKLLGQIARPLMQLNSPASSLSNLAHHYAASNHGYQL